MTGQRARVREEGTPLINPPRFTPRRDRAIQSLGVVGCPTCKCDKDSECLSLETGLPVKSKHRARRVMALRALNS